MRISGGDARGIKLKVPKRVRPASERVRHAVFASLASHVPDASVLDLYAGSGAYGLEAVSRGASSAVLVEHDHEAANACRVNANATGLSGRVRIRRSGVDRYLKHQAASDGPFDLVFADPPYSEAVGGLLERLEEVLVPDGRVVLERRFGDGAAPEVPEGLVVEADRRYGDTRVLVLTRGRSAMRTS